MPKAAGALAKSGAAAVGGAAALLGDADDLDRCIADTFEVEPAGVMSAKEIRPLVKAWCAARGLKFDNKPEALGEGGTALQARPEEQPSALLRPRAAGEGAARARGRGRWRHPTPFNRPCGRQHRSLRGRVKARTGAERQALFNFGSPSVTAA